MIIKAALVETQSETVALVMAPAELMTDAVKSNNIIQTLQKLSFPGKQVVLMSRSPVRGYIYFGRKDLVDFFNSGVVQIEVLWKYFKDYTVNIPGL